MSCSESALRRFSQPKGSFDIFTVQVPSAQYSMSMMLHFTALFGYYVIYKGTIKTKSAPYVARAAAETFFFSPSPRLPCGLCRPVMYFLRNSDRLATHMHTVCPSMSFLDYVSGLRGSQSGS